MGPLDHSAPLCPRVQKSHPGRFLAGTSGDDGGAEQDGLKAAARGFCCSRSAPASPRPLQLCPRSLTTQPLVPGWGAECGGGGLGVTCASSPAPPLPAHCSSSWRTAGRWSSPRWCPPGWSPPGWSPPGWTLPTPPGWTPSARTTSE